MTTRLREMSFSTMVKQEVGWFDDKGNNTGALCARLSGEASSVQGVSVYERNISESKDVKSYIITI